MKQIIRPLWPRLSLPRLPAGQNIARHDSQMSRKAIPDGGAPRNAKTTGDDHLDMAVLQIMREKHCTVAGQWLSVAAFSPEWRKLGLRRKDLVRALVRLCKTGSLRPRLESATICVDLEPAGEERMRSLPPEVPASLHILLHMDELEAGNRRDSRFEEVGKRRRRTDSALQ